MDTSVGTIACLDEESKQKVKLQVEFYFSDSNLPRDKFLRETVSADPDGFVDIALIITFSRLRCFLDPLGGSKQEEIVAAVADLLATSDSLTLSEDQRRVRRSAHLRPREEVDAEVEERSIYASPFSMTTTIDDLSEYFSRHAKVLSIRLRRHVLSKDFKGSVFVELSNLESCTYLLSKANTLEYEGAKLKVMMKKEYIESKRKKRVEVGSSG